MSDGQVRRGSLFWPLFLIGLGLVFLFSRTHPGFPMGRLFAQYWPVLLILLGAVRVMEYLLRRGSGGAIVTGGEVVAIVFLILFGLAAWHFYRTDWPWRGWNIDLSDLEPYRDTFDFTTQVTQRLRSGATVAVSSPHGGELLVRGGEGSEVRVVARKIIGADSEEDAKRLAEQVQIRVAESPSGLEIRPEFDSGRRGRVKRVDLEVTVPAKTNLQLSAFRGDIHVNGVQGNVQLMSKFGDVDLQGIKGKTEVDQSRGSVRAANLEGDTRISGRGDEVDLADIAGEVNIQGEFFGGIKVKNVSKLTHFLSARTDFSAERIRGALQMDSGDLRLIKPEGAVNITTRSKNIEVEDFDGRVQIQNRRGDIRLSPHQTLKQDIQVSNESADIEIILPRESSFQINAVARSNGEIVSDFSGENLKLSKDGGTTTLTGRIGTRGPQISLSTTYGTIRLRKEGES
jgi:DUF4097 and DUF4098 domain-containing protein YvlB